MNVGEGIEKVGAALIVLAFLPAIFATLFHPNDPETPQRVADAGANAIAVAVTPWWADLFPLLATLGVLGALAILAILYLIRKGELPDW